jgi:hypothetical protein
MIEKVTELSISEPLSVPVNKVSSLVIAEPLVVVGISLIQFTVIVAVAVFESDVER